MTRSVRLYTATQFEEVKTLVGLMAERSDLPPAERDRLTAFQADLHSRSRAGHFTVRTELHPVHVRIEAEDSGGPWRRRQPDGRPHGLEVVEALTGPDGWGTETTAGGGLIVWARLGGRVLAGFPEGDSRQPGTATSRFGMRSCGVLVTKPLYLEEGTWQRSRRCGPQPRCCWPWGP